MYLLHGEWNILKEIKAQDVWQPPEAAHHYLVDNSEWLQWLFSLWVSIQQQTISFYYTFDLFSLMSLIASHSCRCNSLLDTLPQIFKSTTNFCFKMLVLHLTLYVMTTKTWWNIICQWLWTINIRGCPPLLFSRQQWMALMIIFLMNVNSTRAFILLLICFPCFLFQNVKLHLTLTFAYVMTT